MKRYDENLKDNADKIILKWQSISVGLFVGCILFFMLYTISFFKYKALEKSVITEESIVVTDTICQDISRSDSLCLMAIAFSIQETKCQDLTSSDGKYVGYLQMSEILVREVNNILKAQNSNVRFNYNDRHDWQSNLSMFAIIMEKHNPTLDIDRAVDIWNKKCFNIYRNQVKIYYQFLIDNITNID